MRSHPGPGLLPGRLGRPRRDAGSRPPCARPSRRPGSTRPASTCSPSCRRCGSRPAASPSPPCSAGGASPAPSHAVSPDEVHAVYRVPLSELRDPQHRILVQRPVPGWTSPGFLIGDDHDVICWGFTAGIIARLFEYLGWIEDLPDAPVQELPDYMLVGRRVLSRRGPRRPAASPNTDFLRRRGDALEPPRLAARRPRPGLRPLGLLAGLRHRRLRHRRAAGRRSASASGWRRSRSATPTRRCWSRSARCSS